MAIAMKIWLGYQKVKAKRAPFSDLGRKADSHAEHEWHGHHPRPPLGRAGLLGPGPAHPEGLGPDVHVQSKNREKCAQS